MTINSNVDTNKLVKIEILCKIGQGSKIARCGIATQIVRLYEIHIYAQKTAHIKSFKF
jgi:hypothetical protein